MKHQLKTMLVVVGVLVALMATVFTAAGAGHGVARGGLALAPAADEAEASLAGCTDMGASDVAWVVLNEDFEIEEQVDSYESGVTGITPVFEYECVPRRTTIVTVFSLNGEVVYSDKESLRASSAAGLYGYPLITTDGSPIDDGEWGVEFFNNKTLLTEGVVIVGEGGGSDPGETVTVEGKVTDKKTKKPVRGAVILVLVPGITVEDWVENDQPDDEVYTGAKTNSKGIFTLEHPLERNVEYSIIVVAKGYKPVAADGFVIDDEAEDPVQLDIKLTK